MWRVGKKYGQRAGLEISPHTLRHTFGTRLVRRKGIDIVTVAPMMGHASLETTAICTQPSEEDMAEAVERLGVARRKRWGSWIGALSGARSYGTPAPRAPASPSPAP